MQCFIIFQTTKNSYLKMGLVKYEISHYVIIRFHLSSHSDMNEFFHYQRMLNKMKMKKKTRCNRECYFFENNLLLITHATINGHWNEI